MDNKIYLYKDIKKIILYMLLLIGSVYFAGNTIKNISFLILLFTFLFSKPKYDYFWIVIALILADNPANLFWKSADAIIEINKLKIGYLEVFSLLSFIKVIFVKEYKRYPIFLKKPFQIFLFYFAFLIIYGFIIGNEGGGGTGLRYLYYTLRSFITLPLFFSIPRMLNDSISIKRFLNLIIFLLIVNFLGQISTLILRENLHILLGGQVIENRESIFLYEPTEIIRPTFGAFISFFALTLSFYYYFSNERFYNRNILFLIATISFITIIFSATRTWIIAYSIFFLITVLSTGSVRRYISIFWKIGVSSLIIILILSLSDSLNKQVVDSTERLITMQSIASGDLTARGTSVRLTDRHFPVMEKFYEQPIFGWGFSKVGIETWDGHVGYQSTLMFGGIIGFSLLLFILGYFVYKIFNMQKSWKKFNGFTNKSITALSSSFITLFIINGGSQIFGYFIYSHSAIRALVVSIFFAVISSLYNEIDSQKRPSSQKIIKS